MRSWIKKVSTVALTLLLALLVLPITPTQAASVGYSRGKYNPDST